ncbi:glycosyltransferase family 4 protein [Synechococcus sp. UW140]|uniref:glycosyltransferase family 4 protein n=1 Tax=Synechococcus sp. UW140 TaxID=368503 RepID=UPI003138228C
MRICFFTENYYKGGLDTFLINLVNSWPDIRDDLTLVCNASHPGLDVISLKTIRPLNIVRYRRLFTSKLAQNGCKINRRLAFLVRVIFIFAYQFLQYPILFPWYILTLTIYFKGSSFDRLMVVNGGYPASLLCRSAVIAWWLAGKLPLAVMNFHNSTSRPPCLFILFESFIDKLIIKSSSNIVTVSQACLHSLFTRKEFMNCKKLSFIYNGIKDPQTSLVPISDAQRTEVSRYCLMLATYERRKGHAFLLHAFQSVVEAFPDVQLRIYGDGKPHQKKYVADQVERLGLGSNVMLGDFTSQTSELLSRASVLVVPSQAYESFGLTIIEAMSFGLPIVTTNVGGMPEVVGDSKAGYVCSKDDRLEFAAAIKRLLGSPSIAFEYGKNGRIAFRRRFTSDIMSQKYARIIRSAGALL